MIKTSRQLKDLINNLARKNAADAQLLMRNYMMERFLERVSLSQFRENFILKGGMLVAAMVGLDTRSTMDIDATVRGAAVDVDHISDMISEIISVPVKDGVFFSLKSVSEIMDEAEYPGVRVSMETMFDGVRTPFQIDISTGDAITPREVLYRFHLMFEERAIEILAYSLETVLAEKLETVISRATTNTRMRDFYDLHILCQLYGGTLTAQVLTDALCATARRRGTLRLLSEAEDVLRELADDPHMRKLWDTYRARYSYASELTWDIVLSSVRQLCIAAGLADLSGIPKPLRRPAGPGPLVLGVPVEGRGRVIPHAGILLGRGLVLLCLGTASRGVRRVGDDRIEGAGGKAAQQLQRVAVENLPLIVHGHPCLSFEQIFEVLARWRAPSPDTR